MKAARNVPSSSKQFPLAALLAAVGLTATAALLPGATPRAVAQQAPTPSTETQPTTADLGPIVTVSGEGRISVIPDRAVVRLGATAQRESAVFAQNTVNTTVARATEAIKELGVEGLVMQTSAVSLSPVYDYRNRRSTDEPPTLLGYRASLAITVRVDDIEAISKVIDTAMEQGVNEMNALSFTLIDDRAPRREALAESVAEAQTKAETIANALGGELGELVEVQEAGTVPPTLKAGGGQMIAEMARAAPVAAPVLPGEIEITARVQITYRLVR